MKLSFNDKEVKKMSKTNFYKAFKKYERMVDLDAYYESLHKKKNVRRESE
jgi:hypothetical protein